MRATRLPSLARFCLSLVLLPLSLAACGGDVAPAGGGDGGTNGQMDMAGGGGNPDLSQPVPSADPGAPGPFATTAKIDIAVPVGGSSLQTTVYGPSDDGKTLSQKGPFPLVIVSPGFQVDRNLYGAYAQRLATHGMVAVTQTYRNAGDHAADATDTSALISWLINPTGNNAAQVMGRVDAKRVGLTGHSLGGKISLFTAQKDARVVAAFGIDPVDGTKPPFGGTQPSAIAGMAGMTAATGFVGETLSSSGGFMPCAPAAENYQQFYAKAPAPSFAITFVGATHMQFVDNPNCFVCGLCGTATANAMKVHDLAVKYTTAFFRLHLLGDTAAADHLTGAKLAADAATGAVTLEKK